MLYKNGLWEMIFSAELRIKFFCSSAGWPQADTGWTFSQIWHWLEQGEQTSSESVYIFSTFYVLHQIVCMKLCFAPFKYKETKIS